MFGHFWCLLPIRLGRKVPKQQDKKGHKDDVDDTRSLYEFVQGDWVSRDDLHFRPILLTGTPWDQKVSDANGFSHQELHDLHSSQETLPSRLISKARQSVISVHDGMNEGIEQDKDPPKTEVCGGL